jgi:hypothetical protein
VLIFKKTLVEKLLHCSIAKLNKITESPYSLIAEVDTTRFDGSKLLEFNIKLCYSDIQREILHIDRMCTSYKKTEILSMDPDIKTNMSIFTNIE